MGRSRRRSSRKVSPWLIALALVFYVGAVGALSTESLAFRLLLTLGCIGAVVAIIGGFFAAADSPIAKVSRVARSRMGMVLAPLEVGNRLRQHHSARHQRLIHARLRVAPRVASKERSADRTGSNASEKLRPWERTPLA